MNKEIDLVSQPKKAFWKLSLPIVAFCIFDSIYSIADLVWVSQIDVNAFFAMGISIPIAGLIFSFGDSIGQGVNSMMSRFIGSGDYENAYNTLIHGIILANMVWVAIVICALFAQGILFYIDKSDSYILVFDYLIPIVIFAYVFIFVNIFSETMQAEGNSRIPTLLTISTNILNIVLDPIFIFTFNLGIKGAAYATVLSSMIAFSIFIYLYTSGRTKVPLALKYFKFHPYIIVEIFKVALPNFLDDGLWAFSASFINSILIVTTGEIGPILYSTSNKIKSLLSSPIKGYGRALMSVTGHLFGAQEFEELNGMYKYVLKVSFITTLVVMCVFFILRDFVFGLFSITGMETEVFWIAVLGTVIMLSIPFSIISSKMLDGFGKSMYSLVLTFLKIVLEMLMISQLHHITGSGNCVLIGITISEILFATIYYMFLRYLFNNFDEIYKDKGTVRRFGGGKRKSLRNLIKIKGTGSTKDRLISNVPLILIAVLMAVVVVQILVLPIRLNDYHLLFGVLTALNISVASIYLIRVLKKPTLSIFGIILSSIIFLVFMGRFGYVPTLLFIVMEAFIVYITFIIKNMKKRKKDRDAEMGE